MGVIKVLKWSLALAILSGLVGSAAALFLWALDAATRQRFENPWLIYLLPFAGVAIGCYYRYYGKRLSSGNASILQTVHADEKTVPPSLAPSILISTIATHLFGGSAGREGTAVQMGAGLASWVGGYLASTKRGRHLLLFCGIAAGFGAVFGTPVAGAIFALEFVRHRILSHKILFCLLAAFGAHLVCLTWGAVHTPYPAIKFSISSADLLSLSWKLVIIGAALAISSRGFIFASRFTARKFEEWFPHQSLRAFTGGAIVIGLFLYVGTGDYLGLGVLAENEDSLTLTRFISPDLRAPDTAWLWKIIFTIVTLSAGFKGGEVTPLFFIGAALGNSIAWHIGAPVDLFAGIGMIAFFAAATKTPYASFVMGLELLGWHLYAPLAISILIATRFSGRDSIYPKIQDLKSK